MVLGRVTHLARRGEQENFSRLEFGDHELFVAQSTETRPESRCLNEDIRPGIGAAVIDRKDAPRNGVGKDILTAVPGKSRAFIDITSENRLTDPMVVFVEGLDEPAAI